MSWGAMSPARPLPPAAPLLEHTVRPCHATGTGPGGGDFARAGRAARAGGVVFDGVGR
ncbi:hypothetical protein GCM10009733_102030 [Nonomuraea maheshkhaliensis]|uniref:Uncharacterized protein n=1 Tax=Nonomuraea maheshkhaliensis TaxID=419590 RepID=A0ABP4TJQ3_9ACTN